MKKQEINCMRCGKPIKTSDKGAVRFRTKGEISWFCKECGRMWLDFLHEYDMIIG